MVVEGKRRAEDSALVPVTKKSKNEVAVTNKNKSVLQAVSFNSSSYVKILIIKLTF